MTMDTEKSKSRKFDLFISLFKNIGMEVPLCLYMLTSFLKYPVFQNLIFEKVCLQKYENDYVLCTNVTAYYEDRYIQSESNHFYSISSYTLMFPSLITTLVLGVASDFWSVKIPLLIPFFGLILCTMNYIVQSVYMEANLYYLLISDAIFGVCGGYISIISTTMSYGVKTTGVRRRSYRIAGMEGAIGLGGTIGYAISGTVREALGYAYTFLLMLVIQCICFLYILFVAKDTYFEAGPTTEQPCCAVAFSKISVVVKDFYQMLAKPRSTRALIWLNLLALGVELLIYSGLEDIQYSYLRYKLAWNDVQYGWFSGLSYGLTTFTVLTLYPLLRSRGFSDGLLGCFGLVLKIASLIMLAFVANVAMAYSTTAVTMLNRFVSSGFRAFISSLIHTEEQGKMFSLIALLEGATNLIATGIYNNVYPLTLSFFPGLCYFVSAFLLLPALFILGVSDFVVQKRAAISSSTASENSSPTEYENM